MCNASNQYSVSPSELVDRMLTLTRRDKAWLAAEENTVENKLMTDLKTSRISSSFIAASTT